MWLQKSQSAYLGVLERKPRSQFLSVRLANVLLFDKGSFQALALVVGEDGSSQNAASLFDSKGPQELVHVRVLGVKSTFFQQKKTFY